MDRDWQLHVYRLAWTSVVVYDSAHASVHADQRVEQFESPATFIVGRWPAAHGSLRSAVVDLDPKHAAAETQSQLDRPGTMLLGVGEEF